MAFIRKHRLMLVPLFLVATLVAGVFLLLRSESEEPSSGTPDNPIVTIQAWQEDVAKRSQHAREYKFVRTIEYVDPETKETVTDEIISTVRERGTNVCYRDAEGNWVPSVAEWEAGGLGFKMDRNSWQIEVPSSLGAAYNYTVGAKTLAMRPRYLLLSDGTNTVSLGELDLNVLGSIDPNDPAKLVFADVLGTGSGVDIELIVERASLHQNVVLRTKPTLPQGFDEENARLYVYTELGLDAMTADGSVGVTLGDTAVNVAAGDLATERNARDPLAFVVQEERDGELQDVVLHQFIESRVWDSTGRKNETSADRQLWRNPADYKTYLVESIPYSYIADATGAITLDYENQNGTIDEDETWTADATYYVSGDVNVGENATLTIEPGTVIKFAEDSAINVTGSGANILAEGEPYNYIVFTSDQDDNSGDDLTEGEGYPQAGDYDKAINIGPSASADWSIAYCKIGYASTAIKLNTDNTNDFDPIEHCIIRKCAAYGIEQVRNGGSSPQSSGPDFFNCLFADIEYDGVYVTVMGAYHGFTVSQSTFDTCGRGVSVYALYSGGCSFTVESNLFTNDTTAVYFFKYDTGGMATLGYNAYYPDDTPVTGCSKGNFNVDLDVSPYDTTNTQLGAYFIDTDGDGNEQTTDGSALVDSGAGSASAKYDDPTTFSIEAPEVVDADITSGTLAEPVQWAKRSGDTDDVDIGYHHPRVDKVIDETRQIGHATNTAALKIKPGVVLAFSGSSARLQFDPDAGNIVGLTCGGDPDEPTILAGDPVVSMDVEAVHIDEFWTYDVKGVLLNDPGVTATASITYTRIMGLHKGIDIQKDSDSEVKHCVFERGQTSLHVNGSGGYTICVANCLFRDSRRGAIVKLNDSGTTWQSTNCTFDGNEIGLVLSTNDGGAAKVTDCLFSNADRGLQVNNLGVSLTHNHNAFWNCGAGNSKKVWKTYGAEEELPIGANSIALLASPYDTEWGDWSDQWYLDQDGACIDAGSGYASAAAILLEQYTTSLDETLDTGNVDIGYHYGGELEGVEQVELKDDGAPIENAQFTSSDTLQIVVDFTENNGTWVILKNGQSTEQTGTGDMDGTTDPDARLSFSGWGAGTYTITITYSAGNTDDIVFNVYIDDTGPTGFAIKFPEADSTVTGY